MIAIRPYSDLDAMAVLSRLDASDALEAQLVRGPEVSTPLGLFGDWRAAQAGRIVSHVLCDPARGAAPFAVLTLAHTGQAGVAQAAMLARDHRRFRRALSEAGVLIRRDMPEFCAQLGIRRIEARCWRDHPTAPAFLASVGFRHEADLPGFGGDGSATFSQFAWHNQETIQ